MLPRMRRARLRFTIQAAGLSDARHNQAHRCRTLALPRAVLLLPVIVAAGLVLALRPGDVIRARPPWTWTPLPATAFGSLPSSGQPSPSSREERRAVDRSMRTTPANDLASPAPADRGGGSPSIAPSPTTDQARRDPATAPAQVPAGAAVTIRGGGPDALSFTAIVKATPTPVPAPAGPTHVVASGDNLWTIARRHSAELAPILRWNEGIDPDRLVAGQRILVPGGAKMTPVPQPTPVKPRTASVGPVTVDPPAVPRDGDHLWPLAVRGDLTRRFSSAHPGIDIAAPQGTRVRAIAEGTVVWAGWKDNGGGYVVEIEHADGMRSTYNHNSRLNVERGDNVAQGDTIALVGSTGRSTGPHLDIRIRMGGRLVDPLRLY